MYPLLIVVVFFDSLGEVVASDSIALLQQSLEGDPDASLVALRRLHSHTRHAANVTASPINSSHHAHAGPSRNFSLLGGKTHTKLAARTGVSSLAGATGITCIGAPCHYKGDCSSRTENLSCCADVLYTLLSSTADFLESNGVPYFLFAGTLLGAVRDEDIIGWTADIDLAVPRIGMDLLIASNGLFAGYANDDLASGVVRGCERKVNGTPGTLLRDFTHTDDTLPYMDIYDLDHWKEVTPFAQYMQGTDTATIRGRQFPIPRNATAILDKLYGDWHTRVEGRRGSDYEHSLAMARKKEKQAAQKKIMQEKEQAAKANDQSAKANGQVAKANDQAARTNDQTAKSNDQAAKTDEEAKARDQAAKAKLKEDMKRAQAKDLAKLSTEASDAKRHSEAAAATAEKNAGTNGQCGFSPRVYRGGDLQTLPNVNNAAQCQSECAKLPKCAYFTVLSGGMFGGCLLKTDATTRQGLSTECVPSNTGGAKLCTSGPRCCGKCPLDGR
jgi:hypothetical protein